MIDECFEKKQGETGRGVDRHSMLLVDLTRSQPRVSTGLILPVVARNHLKRAPQGRGEHTLAAAARAAATWTSARETLTNSRAIDQARHTTTTWERPPVSSAPTLPPPHPRARQISATKQAQDNRPSTGRASRGNVPATALLPRPLATYTSDQISSESPQAMFEQLRWSCEDFATVSGFGSAVFF